MKKPALPGRPPFHRSTPPLIQGHEMSATPMPESARPPVSIPFNLYFHGLDKPAWSAEADGINATPAAAEAARKTRALVSGARRRQVAGLHDSIKRLDKAAYELASLDETGFVDVAAQHLDRRLAHTVSAARSILADIEAATRGYRPAQGSPTDADQVPVDDESDLGHGCRYHCGESGTHIHVDIEAAPLRMTADDLDFARAAIAAGQPRSFDEGLLDEGPEEAPDADRAEAMNALGEHLAGEAERLGPPQSRLPQPTPADIARRTAMAPARTEWPFQ